MSAMRTLRLEIPAVVTTQVEETTEAAAETTQAVAMTPAAGETITVETVMDSTNYGSGGELEVEYEIEIETYDGEVEVPFGALTDCFVLRATVGGDLDGPNGFEVEIVAHPEQRIVRWTDTPGFLLLELQDAWTE